MNKFIFLALLLFNVCLFEEKKSCTKELIESYDIKSYLNPRPTKFFLCPRL